MNSSTPICLQKRDIIDQRKQNDYVHDSKKEGDGFDINGDVTMHYKAWDFEQDDNFTQVNVGPTTISSETFNKKGKSIKKSNLKLAQRVLGQEIISEFT